MIVRAVDAQNDWIFGRGRNDYKRDVKAVAQNIKTRLQSFLGDCFFDLGAGVDWFNLLGAKSEIELRLAISTVILNTKNVSTLAEVLISRSANRNLLVTYSVVTTYGTINGQAEIGA